MGDGFTLILRMSLTASFVIAAVFLVRSLLARVPRRYSYVLWLVVFVRLICPAAIETRYGAVPDPERIFGEWRAAEEQSAKVWTQNPELSAGGVQTPDGEGADAAPGVSVQGAIVGPDGTDIPMRGYEEWKLHSDESGDTAGLHADNSLSQGVWWVSEAAWNTVSLCWLCGCLIFLGCGIAGYFRMMYRLHQKELQPVLTETDRNGKETEASAAARSRRIRILEESGIGTPFTLGIFHPVICLPKGLLPFQREMVLAHECMHIRRGDHVVKLAAYAVRCVHWFNPLVWLAFRYFEEDMEASCDEAVLRQLGYERRKDYAKTLLALSECGGRAGAFYPVSFGRKNSKARIRNVLSVKKAGRWAAPAAMAVVAAAAALLMMNHKPAQEKSDTADLLTETEWNEEELAALQKSVEALEAQIQMREELAVQRENIEALEEEIRREQEEVLREQELLAAQHQADLQKALARAILELMSTMIAGGDVVEGEIHLEDSIHEELAAMMDQVHPTIQADALCALLCNPLIEVGPEGVMVEYAFPVEGIENGGVILSAEYGCRVHPVNDEVSFHSGLDFAAEQGTPVNAAAGGCVYRTGFDEENGNYVILIHANRELTYYTHCESIEVQQGDIVASGQQIATVGSSGKSTGPHLHFAMSRAGRFIAPQLTSNL